jgi:archaellum biogenesis protein FlaJ (TadC family)
LSENIKKANMNILTETYVATIFFSTILSFVASFFIVGMLLFLSFSILSVFWLPIAIPVLTFVIIYYYPNAEKSSLAKNIDQELPFAVIHMSSIAGSGIEPSKIFQIIGLSKEYP